MCITKERERWVLLKIPRRDIDGVGWVHLTTELNIVIDEIGAGEGRLDSY